MESKKIFVTGISGVGKSTVAKELESKDLSVIDVDHVSGLCAWVNLETGEKLPENNTADIDTEFMNKHDYRCDMKMLEKMLNDAKEDIFVFGCVGDNSDLIPLFDEVVLLQCPAETLIERLNARDTNCFGKDSSAQKQILHWHIKFDQLMLEAGAVSINAEQSIKKVVADVMEHFK